MNEGAYRCFINTNNATNGFYQHCCYYENNTLIEEGSGAGRPLRIGKAGWGDDTVQTKFSKEYFAYTVKSYNYCCSDKCQKCDEYREVRRSASKNCEINNA